MSIDKFLSFTGSGEYNCLDFARDVYLHYTGIDLMENLDGSIHAMSRSIENLQGFVKQDEASNLCLVLMTRKTRVPHIGVLIDKKVLHYKDSGVRYEPLSVASLGYSFVGFYKCKC